jgi:hypothetical protein
MAVVAAKAGVLAVVRALERARPPLRRRAATGPGMAALISKRHKNVTPNKKAALKRPFY